jgi:RimJ/RimL family protein N-acetyltransferase
MMQSVELRTPWESLMLRALTTEDAGAYHELVQADAGHLTRLGNYTDLVGMSLPQIVDQLAQPSESPLAFGIYEDGRLSGTIELVPVEPPKYGLGYWLAERACGRGLATVACNTVVTYAREHLNATDVFAGVTHGNDRSVAVLHRCGFEAIRRFDDYTRFHRHLFQV